LALAASTLQSVSPDDYESDDSAEEANELLAEEIQSRTLHTSGDNDWVYMSLSAGDRILFVTGGRQCDTYLYLYAPDGVTVLAEDDDSGGAPNAAIRYIVPEDGVYYGRVRLFGVGTTPCAGYQLGFTILPPLSPDAFEPDDSPVLATEIALDGSPYEHTIHVGGDRDWVSFTLQAPIGIIVATGGECDMFLTLFDRNGSTPLASDDDGGSGNNAAIVYTITESGIYYAEARHFDANDGTCDDYLLGGITQEPSLPDAFEPDNNTNQAKPLPLDGSLQQHSFHLPDDDDWVSFPATAGDRIFIATEGSCDTFISVFGPDRRTTIRENDDSGGELNAALLLVAQETGTHYARVRAFAGSGRGCASYQLYGALVRRGTVPTTPGTVMPVTPTTPGTVTPASGTPAPATPTRPGTPVPGQQTPPPVPGSPTPTSVPLMPIVPEPTPTVR
jgi:hypothetical protein